MFLLFLGLETASVKAQVRIGGNAAPNAAAALDLNATDATNNGTKGLALPRVNLTSNTMQLTTGVVNLTGMLVYNTTATIGPVGIYFWNGATWVKASLPSTSAADSGRFLMSNGTWGTWSLWHLLNGGSTGDTLTLHLTGRPTVSWTLVLDTAIVIPSVPAGVYRAIPIPGLSASDICRFVSPYSLPLILTVNNGIILWSIDGANGAGGRGILCFRPSW